MSSQSGGSGEGDREREEGLELGFPEMETLVSKNAYL